MRRKLTRPFVLTAIIALLALTQSSSLLLKAQGSVEIRIFGLVNNPLDLTRAELFSLPMVSEIATLKCVFGTPTATFNWTGIPLFHLLTLAQVKPEALEVVFRASDGFSSSLFIGDALEPYVILALRANGTLLSEVEWIAENVQGGYRMVVPCKYGFKWVTYVKEIEVVDYDYNGTYETPPPEGFFGYTEEQAKIPDCAPPPINPPLEEFNLSFGMRTFQVRTFTNATITASSFNYSRKEMDLNVTVPAGTTGFSNFIMPQNFLKGPYSILLDGDIIDSIEGDASGLSLLYLIFPEGSYTLKIVGTEFFGAIPDIVVEYDQTIIVDETVTFDARQSVDDGQIMSYAWDFGDGSSGTGPIVTHSYSEEGMYQIVLNVTDNDDLSSSKVLIVTVQKQPQYIPLILRVLLATTLSLLILMFIILMLRRKPKSLTLKDTAK